MLTLLLGIVIGFLTATCEVWAREAGDPIQLAWTEGDVAGFSRILSPEGKVIGTIEYHQHRRGDVLAAIRLAHFNDGSSDEDQVEARVGKPLEAIRGRSIIRDMRAIPVLDLTIDVAGGRITGFSGVGKERETYDEHVTLSTATYWGPLVAIVLRNFDTNASDDRLIFRTVVATPKPRVLDMELVREGQTTVNRPGDRLEAVRFALRPTINLLIDPIVQRLAPKTEFFVQPGTPPAIARFAGPRNYAGQKILIE
jgi:hypothetical protein